MHLSSIRRLPGTRKHRLGLAGGIFLWGLLLAGIPIRVAPVRGASMEPTLQDGQWLAYENLPWMGELALGDLVVFRSPVIPGQRYVKRVAGLGGDELRFEDGLLRVNGEILDLPPGAVPSGLTLSVRVPRDCFFALGDHGSVSYDSRFFGCVRLERLVGKVLWTLSG